MHFRIVLLIDGKMLMMQWAAIGTVVVALSTSNALAASNTCETWAEPTPGIPCTDCASIQESSGIALSWAQPNVWFTHNDAGGSANLYAFTEDGQWVGSHPVTGAGFRDWEDLGAGPCPVDVDAERCIYIADTGDNSRTRDEVNVYVVADPVFDEPAPVVASWRLRYPGEPRDCEAIVVHPCTGRIYLITKEPDIDPAVYRAPEQATGPDFAADLELVAILHRSWFADNGLVTGADWSEGGDSLILRTYRGAWFWRTDPENPDSHWGTAPESVPIDTEGQGESIAFHPDGGVVTTTEGVPMSIVHLRCESAGASTVCPTPEDISGDTGAHTDTSEPIDSATPDTHTPSTPTDSADFSDEPATDIPSRDVDKGGCANVVAPLWVVLPLAFRRRRRSIPPIT